MKRTLALLLALGCGGAAPDPSPADRLAYTEHRVPANLCREPGPEQLDRATMLRDLAVLERLFDRGYAGRDLAGNEEHWSRAHAAAREAVPEQASLEEFRDLLAARYRWLDDNHVGFWYFDTARHWQSTGHHDRPWAAQTLGDDPWDPSCSPTVELVPFWGSEGLSHRPLFLRSEAPGDIECTEDEEPVRYPTERLTVFTDPGGPTFERNGGRAVIRSLMTTNAGALEAFVASAEPLRHEPVVLLDFRFTGGGADRYLVRFFAHFTSQRLSYWTTGALVSETTLQGARNFWGCVRNGTQPDTPGRAWVDQRIARAERDLDEGMARGPFYDFRSQRKHVPPKVDEPFAGRLIVATGPRCASACETAVLLAKQIPGAWIVGQNTSGTMKVGELRWYRLPESKMWVALGRRSHTDPTGEFQEAIGFVPDLWIDGENAEARLDELYACAADPECAAAVDAAIE
ncbi:MAG: hypothetical protein JJ863_07270 [Deltaproteobacteria bacterium]|nr:hypothetical protein [Deltaproteobacteria bacterium]